MRQKWLGYYWEVGQVQVPMQFIKPYILWNVKERAVVHKLFISTFNLWHLSGGTGIQGARHVETDFWE